ncbi:MAG: hypothetical protein V8S34_06855 [Lawsonibacter sp.]
MEVGGHGNTLTEAVDGARLWADNVARTLLALEEGWEASEKRRLDENPPLV